MKTFKYASFFMCVYFFGVSAYIYTTECRDVVVLSFLFRTRDMPDSNFLSEANYPEWSSSEFPHFLQAKVGVVF
jgi:hypothetical protein